MYQNFPNYGVEDPHMIPEAFSYKPQPNHRHAESHKSPQYLPSYGEKIYSKKRDRNREPELVFIERGKKRNKQQTIYYIDPEDSEDDLSHRLQRAHEVPFLSAPPMMVPQIPQLQPGKKPTPLDEFPVHVKVNRYDHSNFKALCDILTQLSDAPKLQLQTMSAINTSLWNALYSSITPRQQTSRPTTPETTSQVLGKVVSAAPTKVPRGQSPSPPPHVEQKQEPIDKPNVQQPIITPTEHPVQILMNEVPECTKPVRILHFDDELTKK